MEAVLSLNESDFDALFDILRPSMPAVRRVDFPRVVEELLQTRVIGLKVVGRELELSLQGFAGVFLISRRLH